MLVHHQTECMGAWSEAQIFGNVVQYRLRMMIKPIYVFLNNEILFFVFEWTSKALEE